MPDPVDLLLWIDIETTGLDRKNDKILEVATIVTDANLGLWHNGPSMVLGIQEKLLSRMDGRVQEMHAGSHLWREAVDSTVTVELAEAQIMDWLATIAAPGTVVMAGSTIRFDRAFIERDMPQVEAWCHYRSVDVSSFKEMLRHWLPQVHARMPEGRKLHRALPDVEDSIEAMRFVRNSWVGDKSVLLWN